jgi:hypothetical protein
LGAGIAISGIESNRTVTVTPVTGQAGVSPVTLTAVDSTGNSNSAAFAVMVLPPTNNVVFFDPFDYAEGDLNPLSANFWSVRVSGTPRVTVTNGMANIRSSGESLLATLARGPYAPGRRAIFYTSHRVIWTSLPGNSVGAAVHLYDGIGTQYARVDMNTNNAPEGFFRLRIASGPSTAAGTYV